ncbi:MAG: hypothetical protein COX19_00265 [Desulfobacterales bacterium CG23_combo_of_CG06-09_8_20_14_all_51_8]|nr:MAG: hypothetical protein COX19_00265 [Desulfobacterales bacterium CG23_combo_of_CG06-09_8_20_14_all_51_8]
MSDIQIPTIAELTQKRQQSLMVSEQVITKHPDVYRQLKKLVQDIISKPVDIGDYYSTAQALTQLLKQMAQSGHGSIFHYYYTQIDPHQKGQAEYFRANCVDLEEQLRCVDQLRLNRRCLRVI